MLEMEETWVWSLCWEEHGNSVQIFLPGESHGQRSLVGYSPCGHKMCLVCTLVWDSWPLYSFQFLLFGMGMSVLSLPHHCILETVSSFICQMWKVILSEVQPYPVYYPYLIRWFRRWDLRPIELTAIKDNERMPFAATQMDLEIITKWNKSERERQIPYDITNRCNLKYNTMNFSMKQKQTHRHRG